MSLKILCYTIENKFQCVLESTFYLRLDEISVHIERSHKTENCRSWKWASARKSQEAWAFTSTTAKEMSLAKNMNELRNEFFPIETTRWESNLAEILTVEYWNSKYRTQLSHVDFWLKRNCEIITTVCVCVCVCVSVRVCVCVSECVCVCVW
jgi:hypothetical protein